MLNMTFLQLFNSQQMIMNLFPNVHLYIFFAQYTRGVYPRHSQTIADKE